MGISVGDALSHLADGVPDGSTGYHVGARRLGCDHLGAAWTDWLVALPLFVAGVVGVFLSEAREYALFGAAGTILRYLNITLWFTEKE